MDVWSDGKGNLCKNSTILLIYDSWKQWKVTSVYVQYKLPT